MKGSWILFKLAYKENSSKLLGLLIKVGLLEIGAVVLLYFLNKTYGNLYQAIQDYNVHVIWLSITKFAGIAGILVGVNGYLGYFLNRLGFNLRANLTFLAIDAKNHGHIDPMVLQFEQRVQEDLKRYGELSVDFWSSIVRACLKLPVFLGVIITLTHWYTGLIILIAIVAGTWFTRWLAKTLIPLQAEQETNEADFRKKLQIVSFSSIIKQFQLINAQIKKLSFAQSGLGQVFVLLPFIVLMPLYISKAIPMGQFFQSVNALAKIIDSLTILIDNRQLIAQLESVLLRLTWLHGRK